MSQAAPKENQTAKLISLPRKASKEVRRLQIIEATIDTLARRGIAQTTLSDVAAAAGVSHGLVIFHFASKENLLGETLAYMSEEYRQNWQAALSDVSTTPASQLDALIRADFNDTVCQTRKLIAWCAFWGEAQTRPFYQEQNGANDDAYIQMLEKICARLVQEGRYTVDPVRAARVIRLTGEGAWLDLLSMSSPYSVAEGQKTVFLAASVLFPSHFSADGLLSSR
jgi:AcrR family transcriptional regulator